MRLRVISILALLAVVSCGPPSRESARDSTVARACNRYQQCGEIATGKTYATRDECEVKQRSFWESAWPAASCDGKINATNLDTCWKAIDIACADPLDLLNVLQKCDKSKVCAAQ
jgi:hypothetical protein